jgi:tetratricopeptide (TPR) repeat protein
MVSEALQHHQAGLLAEAGQMYRQALAIDPHHADALHLLGMAAYQSGQYDEAVDLIRKAIAIHPAAASYHSNLGNVLQAQDKLEEASESYRRALALNPDLAEVYVNLGNVLQAQGDVERSLACYRRALLLAPGLAEASVAESMALLLQGNFAVGWPNFEKRWQTAEYETPMRSYPLPLWKGERLTAGRLLVWGEQGIGDEIMFAGIIPDVIRAGNRIVLDCDSRLKPLFARSFPEATVIAGCNPTIDADLNVAAHLPSGSLPGILRTTHSAFAATKSPYLIADPAERERFRNRFADGRPLIGLAWHTRNKKTGPKRFIDLSLLAPLLRSPDRRWMSLQYGDHDLLEQQVADAGVSLYIDPTVDQLADMDLFAAQVAAMDLVITIDNSTAHLAAALGVPTWLLLPFAPDWRWQLERSDSPWYPTMRIFRQSQRNDWASVVQQVGAELTQL